MKKRILHVIHWPKSGIVTLVRDMLPLFDEKLFEQHVIFFEHDDETRHQFSSIATSNNFLSFSTSPLMAMTNYKKLLHELQPDVLHTHSFLPTILGSIVYHNCLHIVTVHNTYPYFFKKNLKSKIKRWLSQKLYCGSNRQVVAVSHDVKQAILSTIAPHTQIHVIENGIRVDKYKQMSKSCKKETVPCEIISVGRLSLQKDYSLLLKAFTLVHQKKPLLRLTIIGDGPEIENLRTLAQQLGISEKVLLTGWVAEPFCILSTNKEYVYICTSQYEGLPISVLEAMAIGLPVISTNISGITSIVKNNETGFLVDPGNPQQLASKMIRVLEDVNLRKTIGKQGQQYVYEHYDIADAVRHYESLYMGAVHGSRMC